MSNEEEIRHGKLTPALSLPHCLAQSHWHWDVGLYLGFLPWSLVFSAKHSKSVGKTRLGIKVDMVLNNSSATF